ncbi:hypothetical protein [Draconibacterium orientale]|uniref:TolB family protein n=1 Tax=Draconibacterium orientale TaxID=1168034 RepID=UPI002A0AA013|nr:hypothetical protein [Draconibacterium orientale]
MQKNGLKHILYCIGLSFFWACTGNFTIDENLDETPPIFPDYAGVTVPANIAPLHFTLADSCDYTDAYALFESGTEQVKVKAYEKQFAIGSSAWKKLMGSAQNGAIEVKIVTKTEEKWLAYKPFQFFVSPDPVDPYIAYRLIEPGYETWNEMGIYQRSLETFHQTEIVTNKTMDYNCVNCHSFCMQSPDTMLFHIRKDFSGTFVMRGNKIEKLNTKTPETMSPLVYPSWHPSGNFVAFSVNSTKQMFHTSDRNRIEVFDYKSDVVIYDVEKHEIFSTPELFSKSAFETFPTFSPDGKTLYFCSADSVTIPDEYEQVRYNLCSITFDPASRRFGEEVDTLVNASAMGKSISFPRVSPDGNFLMFTLFDYGNFSIWHREADLYLLSLADKTVSALEVLNSNETESYHSWSSNSRWVVFSSRRLDGLYTRPFIAHIDKNGVASKPFLLPQDDVDYYTQLLKSFNIPEFVKGKINVTPYQVSQTARNEKGVDVQFKN